MNQTIRTTIRIKKDILDASRNIAFNQNSSLQDVINNALALGLKHITNLSSSNKAFREIDSFREKYRNKNINLKKLITISKKDLK